MAYQTPLTIKSTLKRIAHREYVIPAIQREFVWTPDQMCGLFDSLLRKYPIGTFLFWRISAPESANYRFYEVMRDFHELKNRHSPVLEMPDPQPITAILDGQQRLTSMNIGLNGSYAVKRPRARSSIADAYPVTRMYLDLTHVPDEDDERGVKYLFRFLTDEDAGHARNHSWFLAADALRMESGREIIEHLQRARISDHPSAYDTLYTLWEAVTQTPSISYFELDESDLGEVLDIFIRVNSGGTILSKSDLLLSVATAQFTNRDARETVHGLVDDLNTTGNGFSFNKDQVLKAGLLLTNQASVAVVPKSLTPETLALIDESWDRIDSALTNAVHLLAAFGFSAKNLPAASIVYPLATYLDHRRLDYDYVTSAAYRVDREVLQKWAMRMLLAPGIWGSSLDRLITVMRRVIHEHGSSRFPARELEEATSLMGKSLSLSIQQVEQLVDTKARAPRAFVLLSVLYPGADMSTDLHIDHIFPKKLFTTRALRAAGISPELHDEMKGASDRLANLQLLRGVINTSKQAMLPMVWARERFPNSEARSGYLAENDMHDLAESMDRFLPFYDARRARMIDRLVRLFGADHAGRDDSVAALAQPTRAASSGRAAGASQGHTVEPARTVRPTDQPPHRGANVGSPAQTQTQRSWRNAATAPSQRTQYRRSLVNVEDGPVEYRVYGVTHRGWIEGSELVLDDGRRFKSPSGAGRAVNGGTSVNGWRAWTRDGVEIRDLHQ